MQSSARISDQNWKNFSKEEKINFLCQFPELLSPADEEVPGPTLLMDVFINHSARQLDQDFDDPTLSKIKELLQHKACDLLYSDSNQNTLLHHALYHRHFSVVREILAVAAETNQLSNTLLVENDFGDTPFTILESIIYEYMHQEKDSLQLDRCKSCLECAQNFVREIEEYIGKVDQQDLQDLDQASMDLQTRWYAFKIWIERQERQLQEEAKAAVHQSMQPQSDEEFPQWQELVKVIEEQLESSSEASPNPPGGPSLDPREDKITEFLNWKEEYLKDPSVPSEVREKLERLSKLIEVTASSRLHKKKENLVEEKAEEKAEAPLATSEEVRAEILRTWRQLSIDQQLLALEKDPSLLNAKVGEPAQSPLDATFLAINRAGQAVDLQSMAERIKGILLRNEGSCFEAIGVEKNGRTLLSAAVVLNLFPIAEKILEAVKEKNEFNRFLEKQPSCHDYLLSMLIAMVGQGYDGTRNATPEDYDSCLRFIQSYLSVVESTHCNITISQVEILASIIRSRLEILKEVQRKGFPEELQKREIKALANSYLFLVKDPQVKNSLEKLLKEVGPDWKQVIHSAHAHLTEVIGKNDPYYYALQFLEGLKYVTLENINMPPQPLQEEKRGEKEAATKGNREDDRFPRHEVRGNPQSPAPITNIQPDEFPTIERKINFLLQYWNRQGNCIVLPHQRRSHLVTLNFISGEEAIFVRNQLLGIISDQSFNRSEVYGCRFSITRDQWECIRSFRVDNSRARSSLPFWPPAPSSFPSGQGSAVGVKRSEVRQFMKR